MALYTRRGDKGASILDCRKLPKYSAEFEALGTIDELNSFVGLTRAFNKDKQLDSILEKIQHYLFDLGADIEKVKQKEMRIKEKDVKWLEQQIDKLYAEVQHIPKFILPAGTVTAALFHVARTVCRRAEREIVKLEKKESKRKQKKPSRQVIPFINRLSTLFFVLARVSNKRAKKSEIVWKSIK
jgi:cob(I)alamin adenosyltransferase